MLRRSQAEARPAPGSDAVDRSSPAAVPDAASAACEVTSSVSWLRRNQISGKLQDANAGSLNFHFARAAQRAARACRGCCDAVADDCANCELCTRKHLVLASHNLLCQTCSCKRPREGPANGEGKDNGPLDRHCAARCISCRSHTDHSRTEPDHHAADTGRALGGDCRHRYRGHPEEGHPGRRRCTMRAR